MNAVEVAMTVRRKGGLRELWPRMAGASARIRLDLPLAMLDLVLIAAAYAGVLILRFDGAVPGEWWSSFRPFVVTAVLIHLGVNWAGGLYQHLWRHASFQEARHLLTAGTVAGVLLSAMFLTGNRDVPASVVVLGAVVATCFMGALRFQSRLFYVNRRASENKTTRVLVIGAGESGARILREMHRDGNGLRPVALLDDDPRKHGRSIAGTPVLGGVDAFASAVDSTRPDQVLLAIPSADNDLVQRVAVAADNAHLPLKVLPKVSDLVAGEVSLRDVRDLEIDDLLGRQQVRTDLAAVTSILRGKRVLITGAGGSIGSEITRQVAACEPSALLMLDKDETHLYDVAASVARCDGAVQLLADIRDASRLAEIFERHAPEVVFHAAAHKHVPLLEGHPTEAAATNVFGTKTVVDAALRAGVERFVFISTDKAVRPSSVMGASKRVAEQVLLTSRPHATRFCAVRFGNVLGSRGSVIPTFVRQIREGGPVTVTDPRMTRFFMSIEEAVQLVLQAAALANGGEIFMLEMGEPIRIIDLAERMIRLSGRRVGIDVAIQITGMRAGEKLEEELHAPYEATCATLHPAIVALRSRTPDRAVLAEGLDVLADHVQRHDETRVKDALFQLANLNGRILDAESLEESLAVHGAH